MVQILRRLEEGDVVGEGEYASGGNWHVSGGTEDQRWELSR